MMVGLSLLSAIVGGHCLAVVAIAASLPVMIGLCIALFAAACYAEIELRNYSITNQSNQSDQ